MTLGQSLGSGSGITKVLMHLNGNSTDVSGNNNNGTDTNITYSLANGKFGQGAGFNGTNSNILRGLIGGTPPTTVFTCSAWVAFSSYSTTTQRYIMNVGRDAGIVFAYGFSTINSGYPFFEFGSGIGRVTLTWVPSNNVFYHLLVTADGTTGKVYLNGVLNNSALQSTGAIPSSPGLGIGCHLSSATPPTATTYFHAGAISEFILENVVWSPVKIQKYYTFTKGRFGI